MVVKSLKLHYEYLKISFNTAIEYKFNFLTQITGMIINDFVWIIFWFIFFLRFENVGLWEFRDVLMLYSIITVGVGLSGFLMGNRREISSIISTGKLDYYLVFPKNPLHHVLISKSVFYDLGDLLFGLIIAFFVVTISKLPLYIFFCITCMIVYTSFCIISESLAFYFGNARATSRNLSLGVLGLASYPFSVFQGFTRFLLLTILPAGFMTGVPVELMKEFNLFWFLMLCGFSIFIFILSIIVFNHGLKKYESGNMINVRM